MDLKKKNTDVDEIKEKLKKYYKLYVSINYFIRNISSNYLFSKKRFVQTVKQVCVSPNARNVGRLVTS